MGRRRDAVLALVVAVPVVLGVVEVRAPFELASIFVGVGGTLVLEAALSTRHAHVRRLWDEWVLQVLSVFAALCIVSVAVVAVGGRVLVVVLSGLVTYLLLLAVAELRDRLTGRR